MSEGESREIYRFPKNADEDLVFKVHQYMGRDYFDIRVWKRSIPGVTEEIPTGKGVTIAMDCFQEFTEGVSKLSEAYYQGASDEKP